MLGARTFKYIVLLRPVVVAQRVPPKLRRMPCLYPIGLFVYRRFTFSRPYTKYKASFIYLISVRTLITTSNREIIENVD